MRLRPQGKLFDEKTAREILQAAPDSEFTELDRFLATVALGMAN